MALALAVVLVTAGCGWTWSGGAPGSAIRAADPAAADGTGTGAAPQTADIPAPPSTAVPTPTVSAAHVARFAAGVADEASGVAAATATPGAFFVVDDPTGTDGVAAVDGNGTLLARISVAGMSAGNARRSPPADTADDRDRRCRCANPAADGPDACTQGTSVTRSAATTSRSTGSPSRALPPPDGPVPADAWDYRYPMNRRTRKACWWIPTVRC